jgi:hypothetical protein
VVADAYNYGKDDGSDYRKNIVALVGGKEEEGGRFVEMSGDGHEEAASKVKAAQPHVLIDMQGFTLGGRPEITARRVAPVQVSRVPENSAEVRSDRPSTAKAASKVVGGALLWQKRASQLVVGGQAGLLSGGLLPNSPRGRRSGARAALYLSVAARLLSGRDPRGQRGEARAAFPLSVAVGRRSPEHPPAASEVEREPLFPYLLRCRSLVAPPPAAGEVEREPLFPSLLRCRSLSLPSPEHS